MINNLYSIVMTPLLRAFLVMLGTTTGIWIRFEKIRGDFFSYKVHLDGVFLKISEHLTCSAETCSLQFSILDASLDTLIVSNVYLEGARFEYDHVSNQDMLPSFLPSFLIKKLTIKDGIVVFKDHTRKIPASLNVCLDNYHCEALHSDWLIFNAMFSAGATGQIEASPYVMTYREEGAKSISQWRINDLPLRLVTPFADGKLDLIKQSSMDLVVTSEWLVHEDIIRINCQVLLSDLVKVELPKFLPVTTKMFADALGVLINYQVKEIPVGFEFKMRKDDFMNLQGLNTIAIFTAFAEGLIKAILDKNIQKTNHLLDLGMLGLDTLRDIKNIFDKY